MWLCSAFLGVREDWAEGSLHAIVCAPSHHQRWELQQFQSTKEVMARFCFRGRWCIHCFVCQIIARIIKRIWIRLILHVWTRFCSTNLFWLPDQMPRHIVNLNRGEAISPCFEVRRSGWWIVRLHLHAIRFFSTAIWYEGFLRTKELLKRIGLHYLTSYVQQIMRYRVQYKHNPSDTRPIAALSKAVGHVRNTEPLMTGEERHQRRELITLISAT